MTTHETLTPPARALLAHGYVVCIQDCPVRFNRNARGLCYEMARASDATLFKDLSQVAYAIEAAKVPVNDDVSIKVL